MSTDSTDLTRHHLNELGGNPLRLHCMPALSNRLNWVEIHWIDQAYETDDAQFDQASSQWISTQFDQASSQWIGWKSIEITLYACLVELGGNPLRLHCMPAWLNWSNWVVELVKFGRNPLNRPGIWGRWCPIQPGIISMNWVVKLGGNPLRLHCMPAWLNRLIGWSNWSNWVEIHWIDQASSQWISTQFDQFDQASSQWIGWSNWVEIHWDYIVCLPGRIGWSNWVEIHWDYIVCLPGRIGWIG